MKYAKNPSLFDGHGEQKVDPNDKAFKEHMKKMG